MICIFQGGGPADGLFNISNDKKEGDEIRVATSDMVEDGTVAIYRLGSMHEIIKGVRVTVADFMDMRGSAVSLVDLLIGVDNAT